MLAFLAACGGGGSTTQVGVQDDPGLLLVQTVAGEGADEIGQVAADAGWTATLVIEASDPDTSWDLWRVTPDGSDASASGTEVVLRLQDVPAVLSVSEDHAYGLRDSGPDVGPQDPYDGDQSEMPAFDDEIDLAAVRAQPAFAAVRVPPFLAAPGAGVTVAVLDGGFDLGHETLDGHVSPSAFDAIDGDDDPQDLGNGVDDDSDGVTDAGVGHGTAVAGLVALVAPEATILPIRVLDDEGVGDAASLSVGIHAALGRGARVLCLSAGGRPYSPLVQEALERANALGALVVCSSGNEGRPSVNFPASSPSTLSVLGTTLAGTIDPASNVGRDVDLGAPSADVWAPCAGGRARYARWNGTSFSAALVAGCAALALSAHPELDGPAVGALLVARARPYLSPSGGSPGNYGAGTVDAEAAVAP